MKCFVYGTLKRGYGNHDRLLAGKEFLGIARTVDTFDMINASFPVIVPNEQGFPVVGEVFDITGDTATLDGLDRLEGEGVMYDRKEITVILNDDRVVCSVYIGNPKYWGRRGVNNLTDPRYVTEDRVLEWKRVS